MLLNQETVTPNKIANYSIPCTSSIHAQKLNQLATCHLTVTSFLHTQNNNQLELARNVVDITGTTKLNELVQVRIPMSLRTFHFLKKTGTRADMNNQILPLIGTVATV